MDASTFLDVLACVDPPYNTSILEKHRGGSLDQNFIGWNGMDGKHSIKILNDILIVKEDEVLINNIYFYDNNLKADYPKVQHRMLLHPGGRCLLIKPPK